MPQKTRKRMVVEEITDTPPEEKKPKKEAVEEVSTEAPQVPEPSTTNVDSSATPSPEPVEKVEETPASTPTSNASENMPETNQNDNKLAWILVPGIMLLGALLGGIVFYQSKLTNGSGTSEATPTPVATAQASATPESSPSADIAKDKYEIAVQNGSGIKGEAGVVQSLLEKAGFTVSSATNADKFDYTKSVIESKKDVEKDFLDQVSSTLSDSYSVSSSYETLPESSKNDVVVIVGSTKN